jgi:SAM-dependent methyltransferase
MFSRDTEQQAAAFDAIGEQYDKAFSNKSAQVAAGRWLLERLPRGARVLDAGCGTGVPTARMLAEGGLEVLGIDISQEMLRLARSNVPTARFERMDLAAPSLPPGSFEGITAFFSLLMVPRKSFVPTVRNLARLLRPGGCLVLSMVEADLDDVPLPFLGQTVRVSGFPQAELEARLKEAGLAILESSSAVFEAAAPGAPPERQLFYCCQVEP